MAYQERGPRRASGEVLLEAQEPAPPAPRVNDVSFTLHPGEILGLAGLMGSGRTELARALFGIDSSPSGEVLVRGQQRRPGHPGTPSPPASR